MSYSLKNFLLFLILFVNQFEDTVEFEGNEEDFEFEEVVDQDDDYNGGNGLGRGYGELCNKTDQCDPELWLSCVHESCGCKSEQIAIPDEYDGPSKTYCIGLAGANCESKRKTGSDRRHRKLRSLSSFFGIRLGMSSPNFYKNMDCIENAECDGFRCICHPDFFRNSNGTCVKKKSMYQKCTSNDECQKSESLVCLQGKCRCPSALIAERNSQGDRKCMVPAGGICNEIMGLTKNENGYNINDNDCVKNADCSGRTCECNHKFRISTDKTCGGDFGSPCGKGRPCSDIQFVCRDSRCQCRYSAHQYYDEERRLCLSLANGPCFNPINTDVIDGTRKYRDGSPNGNWGNKTKFFKGKCSPNAICVNNGYFNECLCKSGFAEDSGGKCIKTYGATCDSDEDCSGSDQLSCVNSKCKCPDGYSVYSAESRRCFGLVGSRCSRIGFGINAISNSVSSKGIMAMAAGAVMTPSNSPTEDTPGYCIQNASCVQPVKSIQGKCICNGGFEPTGNRTCRLLTTPPSPITTHGIKAETKNSTFLLT